MITYFPLNPHIYSRESLPSLPPQDIQNSLRPITVRQMANATSEHDDATFFLDGNELGPVSLVESYKSKKEGILWEGSEI